MIILNVLLVLLHINCHEFIALDADMAINENYMFLFVCFFQFIHLWSLRRTVPFLNRDRKKGKIQMTLHIVQQVVQSLQFQVGIWL